MVRPPLLSAAIAAVCLFVMVPVRAQDAAAKQYVDVKIAEPPKQDGLELTIKNGATFSLVDTRDVVGIQPNGSTLTFGLKFDGVATYRKGKHEWRNILGLSETLTKTPALLEPVKSADALAFDSTYLYFVRSWVGPFARFALGTPVFRGYDVRAGDTTYSITRNGAAAPETVISRRLTLTEPFKPLTMRETIGPFARPFTGVKFNVEIRIGLGALQTFADGQLLIKDDASTADRIEVQELSDVFQIGGEGAIETWGAIYEKKISYKLGIGVLVPSTGFGLTNVDVGGALSVKVVEWATLDYEVKAVRQPQLVDVWQVRNGLMLTLGLGYERKPPKPPEPPKAAPAAAAEPATK